MIDEEPRRMVETRQKLVRQEQSDVALTKTPEQPQEPLSLPAKKMLAFGRKLAEGLTRLADDLDRAMEERQEKSHLWGRLASFSGLALSAGFVAWILRSGSLVASFLFSMPAWRHFDPLPVLGAKGKDRKQLEQKAREAQAQESTQFRDLDRVMKAPSTPSKPSKREEGQTRRPS
jgi:hypothetical protein